jgi:AcrR family transcriptional regulator
MTKDSIIIAALRLFLLRGYKNVSLIDVANEVNITKGGIYHYFGSKQALFHEGISYLFTHFENKYAEFFSQERSFRQMLDFMLGGAQEGYMADLLNIKHSDYRANNANIALEIMHNFPDIQERIDLGQLALRDFIQEKIKISQENGEARQELDAQSLANLVLAVSGGLNVMGKNMNTLDMRQEIVESLWQLIGVNLGKE